MHIEITGELEQLITSALASGRFASAEQFIETVVRTWPAHAPDAAVPTMRQSVDAAILLREQGIGPCNDPAELATDVWPMEDAVDDFLRFLRQARHDARDRTATPEVRPLPHVR
jgi:hypothetical protein